MVTGKRKNDEFGYDYDDEAWQPSQAPRGCDTYFSGALQYPFHGRGALMKLFIAALVNLIPILGSLIFTGYALRTTRYVMEGDDELPAWDDFGGDFVNGLVFIIGMCVFGVLLLLSFVLIVTIPIAIFFGFSMYAYVTSRYAMTGDFAAFFDIVGAYRSVFTRFGDALIMTLASVGVVFVFSILIGIGTVFFLVPGLIASAAATLALAYNAGMFGRAVYGS